MATICTHVVDGQPVTEVVEDGVVRAYDPAEFEMPTSSGTSSGTAPETGTTTAPRKGRAKPGDRAKLGS